MRSVNTPMRMPQGGFDVPPRHDIERLDDSGVRLVRRGRVGLAGGPWPLPERGSNIELPALPDEHGAIHHRRHLSNISRPAVLREYPHVVIGDRHRSQAEPVGRAFGEILGEHPYVAGAVAQGRNHDREHGKAVVQVFTERLRLDHRRQIAVSGGDDADADADGSFPSDADHFAILDDAQETHLRGERQLADFVEKQRPAVSLLEPAFAAAFARR